MKHIHIGLLLIGIVVAFLFYEKRNFEPAIETITFFPIDPTAAYKKANTTLSLKEDKPKSTPILEWRINSELDRKAYIRQDLGFLFSNGRLIGKLGDWKQNTPNSAQTQSVKNNKNSLYQAITFHYSELHGNNDTITSAQQLSTDYLYVTKSKNSKWQAFRNPIDPNASKQKKAIDDQESKELEQAWLKVATKESIKLNNYETFPLTDLSKGSNNALRLYSKNQRQRILGNLWEGLYKNYFLGIKLENGSVVSPINSKIPLILIAKDRSHLLVLLATSQGDSIVLRQMIQ